ncbi:hypothetical protein [Burkholderia contaminans]|uniref:hypothetical protein n=1 Tax=Burkholderia contaminans TaxID=488447 RepID=UPI001581E388|nr:hypothetical protein [Burkholderia contaminans]
MSVGIGPSRSHGEGEWQQFERRVEVFGPLHEMPDPFSAVIAHALVVLIWDAGPIVCGSRDRNRHPSTRTERVANVRVDEIGEPVTDTLNGRCIDDEPDESEARCLETEINVEVLIMFGETAALCVVGCRDGLDSDDEAGRASAIARGW